MISKTSILAVLALVELARLREGEHTGVGQIAVSTGAPPNYLGKILRTLVREGLVESQRGYGGGFRLSRRPGDISLYDVVEPIEQVSRWNRCFLGRGECTDESPCAIHAEWREVRSAYLHFLCETTIQKVMKNGSNVRSGVSFSAKAPV